MEVDLQELLIASRNLAGMADVYEDVIGRLRSSAAVDSDVFETDELHRAWVTLRDQFWIYAADTQDNLNASSTAFLHYINAVCREDGEAARALREAVAEFNDALERMEADNELDIDRPVILNEPDHPDGVVEVPEHDRAERPPEA